VRYLSKTKMNIKTLSRKIFTSFNSGFKFNICLIICLAGMGMGFVYGQAKIGTGSGSRTPDEGSMLEIESTNRGFLPPRISLTDSVALLNSTSGTALPSNGMIVYNTNANKVYTSDPTKSNGLQGIGLYIWNTTQWFLLATPDYIKSNFAAKSSNTSGIAPLATGANAFAIGRGTQATSLNSFAYGGESIASNYEAFAGGLRSKASGLRSIALGYEATSTNTQSLALGTLVSSTADYSTALGNYATAANSGSFVIGDRANTTPITSLTDNSMTMRFAGGYRFLTNAAGTTSVNMASDGLTVNSVPVFPSSKVTLSASRTLTAAELPIKQNVTIQNTGAATVTVTLPSGYTFSNTLYGNTSTVLAIAAGGNVVLNAAAITAVDIVGSNNPSTTAQIPGMFFGKIGGFSSVQGVANNTLIWIAGSVDPISNLTSPNTSTVVLKAGKYYSLHAEIGMSGVSTSGSFIYYQWRKVSGSVLVGNEGLALPTTFNGFSSVSADAIVQVGGVDEQYQLIATAVPTGQTNEVHGRISFFKITEIK